MNVRELIKYVTKKEGGKINLPVAQVAEVVKHTLIYMAHKPKEDVQATLNRYKKRKR